MKFKRSVVWCSCGCHAISIERVKYDGEVVGSETNIQLWQQPGMMDHTRLLDRIKDAWWALRGKLNVDYICLDGEAEVQKLVTALQEEPHNWKDEE